MRVGVSGHQARAGIDWAWVRLAVRDILAKLAPVERGFTSLAVGSDQVFAEESLALGIEITAVVPLPGYERLFRGPDLERYRALLGRCAVTVLPGGATDEASFLAAGQHVADLADALLAIWDGLPAAGQGGTADVVAYARGRGRRVIHVDPIERTISGA